MNANMKEKKEAELRCDNDIRCVLRQMMFDWEDTGERADVIVERWLSKILSCHNYPYKEIYDEGFKAGMKAAVKNKDENVKKELEILRTQDDDLVGKRKEYNYKLYLAEQLKKSSAALGLHVPQYVLDMEADVKKEIAVIDDELTIVRDRIDELEKIIS